MEGMAIYVGLVEESFVLVLPEHDVPARRDISLVLQWTSWRHGQMACIEIHELTAKESRLD